MQRHHNQKMQDMIDLAILETNEACELSGVNVELLLVQTAK